MIRGTVNADYEGVVRLRVRGPTGAELEVNALVDSGFTSSLALPETTVATLGLARRRRGSAVLADGSVRLFSIYSVDVSWDGDWRPVLVAAVGNEPLLGMGLIAGHRLLVNVVAGGVVEISPLS
jgi:clan AA aspartic protease